MKDKLRKKEPVSVTIMSIVTALFIDSKLINDILIAYGFPEGIMAYMYMGIIGLIFISCTLFYKITKPIKNVKIFGLALVLLLFYIITQSFINEPRVPMLYFCVFTIAALIIPSLVTIDVRILLKSVLIIPLFGLPVINKIFTFVSDWNEWISLGTSYNVIPPILAAITYLFLYYKFDNKFYRFIFVLVILGDSVYLIKLLLYGSRGPVLAIVGLVFLFFITIHVNNRLRINKSRISKLVLLSVCTSFLVVFLPQILDAVFIKMGLSHSHAIGKFIALSQENEVSNGRSSLFYMAFSGIVDSPFWGNGLDQFDNHHRGADYPHNSILQLLYDGGLLFFFIILLPLLSRYRARFKKCSYDEYAFMSFIFFAGIWGSFFTGDLWEIPLLWLAIGSMFSETFIYSRN